MELQVINIKSQHETVSEALAKLQLEIDSFKRGGFKVLKVIHGYGSHGVGGTIKKESHILLKDLKRRKIIEDFIPGEKWTPLNSSRARAIELCEELRVDFDLISLNSGVTIIII